MKKPTNQSFPDMENKILAFWQEAKIFAKSLEQREGGPRFIFYDGPPFATGLPHYGHILQMATKDIVTRYKTMQGYYVPRRNGWDCHGLPVEYELEKELGTKTKADIEKLGVDEFNQQARQIVLRYVGEWTKTMERMGRWVDMADAYTSMSNDYIESVWWVFKQIWDKGYVYQDYRVSPYCPRCGTALSNFEVTQGYKEIGDESVYIKFKVEREKLRAENEEQKTEEAEYFLVWTTTPWTLPGNVALAVSREATYCKVKSQKEKGENKEYLILAKERLAAIKEEYEIIKEIKGEELEGWRYEGLYTQAAGLLHDDGAAKLYTVQAADFVTMEEGTGIVHIAPAFGEDDMVLAREKDLPVLTTADTSGAMVSGLDLPGQGEFVKDADKDIKADLRERGLLYREEKITHAYPFCWRCESPLLYYALPSWYVAVSKVREQLIKNNQAIHWVPGHIKYGRFGKWLEGARDWAISRSRYWGAPIPVWVCEQCQTKKAVGSKKELNLPETFDLHKPQIDEVTLVCPHCGGVMKRVAEVFDCWFESGSMPYAQWHYPFGNKDEFTKSFPADFIAEAIDQTRGWFYTLHVLATMLSGQPAYKNVIVSGLILAEDGRKLSKRLRNYVEPEQLFESVGVDALRFFFAVAAPAGEDYRFSEAAVREQVRKFMLPLWNSYIYLATYAPLHDWTPGKKGELTVLDRWWQSRLAVAVTEITDWLDRYELTKAARVLSDLVTDLSVWYIRRSRKRADAAFYYTLHAALMTIAKLTAPLTPFLAEELYQNLREESEPESVHLTDYPTPEGGVDNELLEQMVLIRKAVELGHALRAEAGIKVRQPLGEIAVQAPVPINPEMVPIVLEELNIKQLNPDLGVAKQPAIKVKEEGGITVTLNTELTPELKQEGLRRELGRFIQELRKEAGYQPGEKVEVYGETDDKGLKELWRTERSALEKETVATLKDNLPAEISIKKTVRIEGKTIALGVKKKTD